MKRVHNFSAGPAILPLEVLQKAQQELIDYKNTGSSLMEKSHRGAEYAEIDAQAKERLKRLLNLGDDFEVLFLQGGASTQFMMVPFNFLREGDKADYLNTGRWSVKAIAEAKRFGEVHVPFTSEEQNFNEVPAGELSYSDDAVYVHFTSNNTVCGTQFPTEPETGGIPLVCDASSDILSRPIDVQKYGVIYAGAQKNLGPAGVTIVIVRKDFLERAYKDVPTILRYSTHAEKIFNTPPTFNVYMVNLVLEWIEEKGGTAFFKQFNEAKAALIYNEIDSDDFYNGTAKKNSRSLMNITFRLPTEELEDIFIKEAAANDMVALKGHRSVGGIRASIYNACPKESVETLVSFMQNFRAKHG